LEFHCIIRAVRKDNSPPEAEWYAREVRKMKTQRRRNLVVRLSALTAVVLALLMSAQVVLAYIDQVVVRAFQVGLVSWEKNVPATGYSTWIYEITPVQQTLGLSHWVLGTYCPPVSASEAGADYSVFFGEDGSTGAYGIKWEDPDGEQLEDVGDLHTFTFVVQSLTSDTIPVTVKDGGGDATGFIMGPYCGTTAVNLTSFEGNSGTQISLILLGLGATIASAGVLRKVHRA